MDCFLDIVERLRNANRYVVAASLFLLWMLTLADVDLIRMWRTHAGTHPTLNSEWKSTSTASSNSKPTWNN